MKMITKNMLQQFGYNLVALPKSDIYPLQILAKHDKEFVYKIGSINDFFAQGDEIAQPAIEKDKNVPDLIEGTYALNLDFKTKLNLLNFWKMIFNGAHFQAHVKNADKLVFSYSNGSVTEINSLLNLNAYINDAKINEKKISTFREQLENNELFIITSVLYSNSFSIELIDNNDLEAKAEISDSKQVVEIETELRRKKEKSDKISYNSEETSLVVGFQAVKLIYNKSFWSSKKANYKVKSKEGIILRSEEKFPVIKLNTDELVMVA